MFTVRNLQTSPSFIYIYLSAQRAVKNPFYKALRLLPLPLPFPLFEDCERLIRNLRLSDTTGFRVYTFIPVVDCNKKVITRIEGIIPTDTVVPRRIMKN